ncbi:MAG TPA: PIN domain-containing protein [Streptosporangiaceae bacterium]|nr:PIN domain-containing protein [Streptosporangiaceae bacterium]
MLHAARHELLVPATVIAEVGYFLAREAGAPRGVVVPTVLADDDFAPVDLTSADYAQIADLVNTYESLPLGTTDASVVAIAKRLGLTDVATLDRRQFTVVRPSTRMR